MTSSPTTASTCSGWRVPSWPTVKTGGRGQGASTITMQLARTTFLSRERSFVRKFYEVLLTLRIEQQLSKSQIFEIYANQIFLGQRSYGFAHGRPKRISASRCPS